MQLQIESFLRVIKRLSGKSLKSEELEILNNLSLHDLLSREVQASHNFKCLISILTKY